MKTTVGWLGAKGGIGKTTSSIMSAEAACRAGHSAAVLDADPQGSASEWAEGAAASGAPLQFSVEDANRATLGRKTERIDAEYVFIDTAPNDPAIIQLVADLADLVIIPTSSNPADMDRAIQTYEAIDGAVALMLCRIDPRRQLYGQARELIEADGIAAFTSEIRSREDINKLWFTGLRGSELYGYDAVFNELHEALSTTEQGAAK